MIVTRPTSSNLVRTAICQVSDIVGNVVYVTGPRVGVDWQVATVDITDPNTLPGIGIIVYKISPTRAVIQLSGDIRNVYTGLTPGATYWTGPGGYPVTPPPIPDPGVVITNQPVGVAIATDVLFFEFVRNIVALQG